MTIVTGTIISVRDDRVDFVIDPRINKKASLKVNEISLTDIALRFMNDNIYARITVVNGKIIKIEDDMEIRRREIEG